MILLMSGGSGFLGSYLVPRLAPYCDKIYLLARRSSFERYEHFTRKYPQVTLVEGDLQHPDLIDNPALKKELEESVTHVLHAGALYDMNATRTESYLSNVVGTQNMLSFIKRAQGLRHFHYVSTIAVSGDFEGRFGEQDLNVGQSFKGSYAETKYLAEVMVRSFAQNSKIKTTIYRPGIIVGESSSGALAKIDGPYYLLSFFKENPIASLVLKSWPVIPFPYGKESVIPLIPVDKVALFIERAMMSKSSQDPKIEQEEGEFIRCYHLLSEDSPTAAELTRELLAIFGIKGRTIALPMSALWPKLLDLIGLPRGIAPYFYIQTRYDQTQLKEDFKNADLGQYGEYVSRVFNLRVLEELGAK